jgi:spermidine/putrescine transport system permease protein
VRKFLTNQRKKTFFAAPFVVFLLMFVLFPLVLLIINSFSGTIDMRDMSILGRSLWVALVVVVICFLIGYPVAYILAMTKFKKANVVMILFIIPMWVNMMLRVIATREMLKLFIDRRSFGYGTLIFGLVLEYLPFMIMPIYVVLSNIDKKLVEASQDLGATPTKTFLKTVFPLSVPGVMSGFLMVFTPVVSTFFISSPNFLGSLSTMMFGDRINIAWEGLDLGTASLLSLVTLGILAACVLATNYLTKIGNRRGGIW